MDGPNSNVPRSSLRLNQLHLTKFRIKFPFTGSTRVVRKAWNDAKIDEQWANSVWAKKVAAKEKVSYNYCFYHGLYQLYFLESRPYRFRPFQVEKGASET